MNNDMEDSMEEKPGINLNAVYLCLCNLNCFGIGYLLAGLKKRWLIALGGNLALLLIAHFTNASKQPLLWALIFLVAFIGMAVDLWLLIKKDPNLIPPKLTGKAYLLPAIAAAVILIFFGGFFAYRTGGNKLIAAGQAAYEAGDYPAAFKNLYSADQLYRLSLNKGVVEMEGLLNEVSVIVAGQSYAAEKEYAAALDAVNKFHEFYPESPKTSEMNNLAIDTNLAWAKDFQSDANYQACLEHFETILADYPDEAAKRKSEIDEAMAENYLKWGESLSTAKDYALAVEKLEMVVDEYSASSVFDSAYQAAAQANYDLAMSLQTGKDFSGAVAHLLLVQDKYPQSEVVNTAKGKLPEALIKWGGDLRGQEQFIDALEKYGQVADYTTDEKVLAQADGEFQETVNLLARDSGADGAVVIEQARLYACGDEPVTDPSIDIFPEEQGKALACAEYDADYIPTELAADIPGTFRYVVSFEDASRRVQSCDYVTSSDSRTLERWQYGTTVTVTSVKSGSQFSKKTFYGASPESCPNEYWFTYMTEETWGEYVEDAKIRDWLAEALK